jgi:hypothetical protein
MKMILLQQMAFPVIFKTDLMNIPKAMKRNESSICVLPRDDLLPPSSEGLHHKRNIWYNPGNQQTGIQPLPWHVVSGQR